MDHANVEQAQKWGEFMPPPTNSEEDIEECKTCWTTNFEDPSKNLNLFEEVLEITIPYQLGIHSIPNLTYLPIPDLPCLPGIPTLPELIYLS